jgi:hypothetical protein
MRARWSAYLMFLHFIVVIISGDENKNYDSCLLCTFLCSYVTFLGPSILDPELGVRPDA